MTFFLNSTNNLGLTVTGPVTYDSTTGLFASSPPLKPAFGGTGTITPPSSNGQLLISTTGNVYTPNTLTAGAGISITNAPGSITIAANPITFNTNSPNSACPTGGTINFAGLGNIFTDAPPGGCPTSNTVFISLTGTIPVSGGGTGSNSFATNQIVIFNGTSLSSLPSCTTPGQVLVCEGSNIPSWVTITGSNSISVTSAGGTISVTSTLNFDTNSGNIACPSTNGIIAFEGLGNIFTSAVTGGCPISNTVFISLTGSIPVSGGGTGSNSFATNQLVIFNGTALSSLPQCSSPGQVLVCEGSGIPSWVTITGAGGTSVISNGSTITITSSGVSTGGASIFFVDKGTEALSASGKIGIHGCTGGNIITFVNVLDDPTLFICLTGTIPVSGGGTGSSSFSTNQLVIFNGTGLSSLLSCSSPGQILVCEGSGVPSWVSITGNGITVTSTGGTISLTVATNFVTNSGNIACPTNGVINFVGLGSIFTSAITGGCPTSNTVFISLTGTLPVSGGGTNATTFATNQLVIFNGTGLSSLPQCSSPGQVLVCEGSGIPSWVTITGVGGTTVTSIGGTITITSSGISTGGAAQFFVDIGNIALATSGKIGVHGCTGGNIVTFVNALNDTTFFICLTGTIPVSGGGTGSSSFSTNQLVIFNGTGLSSVPACSSPGQVLVCEGSGVPSWVTITGGGSTSVISTGGTITISSILNFETDSGNIACPTNGLMHFDGVGNIFTSAITGGCPTSNTVFISLTGTIPVSGGGTGSSSFSTNQLVVFNGTGLSSLPACSSPGQVLVCEGSGVPSWVTITGGGSTIVTSTGGTVTISSVLNFGTNSGNIACPTAGIITFAGVGNIFTSAVTGGCPSSNTVFISLTGSIPVSGGGTGSNSFVTNQLVIFNGTSLSSLPACSTPGQVLVCEGSGAPSWVTITGSNNITVTSTGSNVVVAGFPWNPVGGNVTMSSNNGYYLNTTVMGTVTLTLPASPTIGSEIRVAGGGGNAASAWTIAANGNTIEVGDLQGTATVNSTNRYDCIELLCIATNKFITLSMVGNLTVT